MGGLLGPRTMRAVRLVLKLGRLKMTVFSAVTYSTAACLVVRSDFDATRFLAGWAFVFFTQLVAHFLGEYYDLPSDKLNCYAGPLTGGSKVLLSGEVTPGQCFALGYACLAAAGTILAYVLPRRCWLVGTVLIFIAHQYSCPPFKCNHRGLGELSASVATNVLLPQFAILVQSASFGASSSLVVFHSSLAVLVVPAFLLKVGLFLALNMADRRPDWLGGKYTIPVLLGDETSARMLAACNVAAYASSICIYLLGLCSATTLAAILFSAPEALSIARAFNPSLTLSGLLGGVPGSDASGGRSDAQRPYRLEKLVVRVLKHAPGVVLAVFADAMFREAVTAGAAAVEAAQGGSYWVNWLSGVAGTMVFSPAAVRYLPLVPFLYMFFVAKPPPPPPPSALSSASGAAGVSAPTPSTERSTCGVVVAGGGVGGLVLGACLQQLGLPFEILEKSPSRDDACGADLALWPAATKVLKELGVGSNESDAPDFWEKRTYPVGFVRICKVEKPSDQGATPPSPLPSSASPAPGNGEGGGNDGASLVATPETVLTKVDMDAVVEGEGEPFRLVGRQAVMSSLVPLVEEGNIRRGVRVLRVEQSFPPGEMVAKVHLLGAGGGGAAPVDASSGAPTGNPAGSPVEERIACRVLVGADGIHSICRPEVHAATTTLSALRRVDGGGAPPRDHDGAAAAATRTEAVRAAGPRDGGEVCYRGVLDLKEGSAAAGLRPLFEDDEKKRPRSMSVIYGDRIRFSWGFIDGARETGYWFVKQLTGKQEGGGKEEEGERLGDRWPEPLRTFARMTGEECSYAHRIQDRPPLDRWSCGNITLLGDACHPATPNNGQGACMAIEDALVLATLLGEYFDQPDGHVEAFYLYERARLAHTRSVQRESLKQMKLGQLTSRVGVWVREKVIKALPPSVLQKKLRAANVYDIDSWLVRFRALKAKQGQRANGRAS